MKYAKVLFTRMSVSPTRCNLGDIAQTMAVEYIYQRMGIPEEEIIGIHAEDLASYRGEKVVLPINGYYCYWREHPAFPTSPDITPVFLGLHCKSKEYLRLSDYWKCNGPIGCRDEATTVLMKKYGYNAFLAGCTTVLFPRRNKEPASPKVFLVDAHPAIEKYIPDKLKQHIVRVTHDIEIDPKKDIGETREYCERIAREVFSRYRDEATLVITSRLHCAVPCLSMGIPTILVKNGFDDRFGWLEKHLHLYTPDEYDKIDWNPEVPDIEDFKEKLYSWCKCRLEERNDPALQQYIEQYYRDRIKKELKSPLTVRGYLWLAQYAPGFASFIREKVLWRFTIDAGTRRKNVNEQ